MIQTVVTDVTRPSTTPYVPPDHSSGERWPGRDLRALRQQTLFEPLGSPASPAPQPCAGGSGAREACGVCSTVAHHADTRVMFGTGYDAAVPIVAMTVPFSVVAGEAHPPQRLDAVECALLRDRINERIEGLAKMRAKAIAKRRLDA